MRPVAEEAVEVCYRRPYDSADHFIPFARTELFGVRKE